MDIELSGKDRTQGRGVGDSDPSSKDECHLPRREDIDLPKLSARRGEDGLFHFEGRSRGKVDAKGRITLESAISRCFKEGVVFTFIPTEGLRLMPKENFVGIMNRFLARDLPSDVKIKVKRYICANSTLCKLGSLSRVTVPLWIRDAMNIKEGVAALTFVGRGLYIEVLIRESESRDA